MDNTSRQLAQYYQMLQAGGGRPIPMQQPQGNGLDMRMIAQELIRRAIGNPEAGILRVRRPDNLPTMGQRSPFFLD